MSQWTASEIFPFPAGTGQGSTIRHDIHVGGEGPPILLLQELPGIGPETLALCARLNASGFRVYMPHLLGPFGRKTNWNTLRVLCVRREFRIFLRGKQSPIAAWLRALVAEISARENGARVGVIGMCLTGCFAIPLMAEDAVAAGVASQPALPIRGRGALHMSGTEINAARTAMATKGPAIAMRYEGDKLVPDAHMEALRHAFGDDLETIDYPGNDHSLLTLDFHGPAYARIETYFQSRLATAPPG